MPSWSARPALRPPPAAGKLLSLYLLLPFVVVLSEDRTHAFYLEIGNRGLVLAKLGASVINILGNSKIRRDSVKRMIEIQSTS